MKRIQKLIFALFVASGVTAVLVNPAFAATEWLFDGNILSAAEAVESEGTLTLTDVNAGVEVECSGIDKGTIGPGAKDEIAEILSLIESLPIQCTLLKAGAINCEEPTRAEPLNLPWSTELVLNAGGEIEDLIAPHSGGGNPGWRTECLIAKIFKIAQECGAADPLTLPLNVIAPEDDVEIMFEKTPGTCANGNKSTVTGSVLVFLTGHNISVS